MKARTLAQVNEAIQREVGNVTLCKGAGYFYVTSDDRSLDLKLQSRHSTSIYVCHLNQQSVEAWISDVRDIAENAQR